MGLDGTLRGLQARPKTERVRFSDVCFRPRKVGGGRGARPPHPRRFLDALRDDDLGRIVEFAIGDGPKQTLSVGEMMHHAAIHGVHHRGQAAVLPRSLGYVPGDFDMVFYYRQLRQS